MNRQVIRIHSPEDRSKRCHSMQPTRMNQVIVPVQKNLEQEFSALRDEKLNEIITHHLNEVDHVKQEYTACKDRLLKIEQERELLLDKMETLEKQKMMLERMNIEKDQRIVDLSNENNQLKACIQQVQVDLHNSQINLNNMYHNHELQIQELHNCFNNEIQEQYYKLKAYYKDKMEQMLGQIKQELDLTSERESRLIQTMQTRQEEWCVERQKLLDMITYLQNKQVDVVGKSKRELPRPEQEETKIANPPPQQPTRIQSQTTIQNQPQQPQIEQPIIPTNPPNISTYPSTNPSPLLEKSPVFLTPITKPPKSQPVELINDSFAQPPPEKEKENKVEQYQSSLGVYSLNTFKRPVPYYDPTYTYSGSQDLYQKYLRKDALDYDEKSRVLQENTRLNNQTQEECRKLLRH